MKTIFNFFLKFIKVHNILQVLCAKLALIEMYAILRALRVFAPELKCKAVFFFIYNKHAVGYLLRRAASVGEGVSATKRDAPHTPCQLDDHKIPQQLFSEMHPDLRHVMKEMAKQICSTISELDIILQIEHVKRLKQGLT